MSAKRFSGVKASNYVFHETGEDRNVVALFAGSRKLAFIEYDALDRLIERLQTLREQHGQKEVEL